MTLPDRFKTIHSPWLLWHFLDFLSSGILLTSILLHQQLWKAGGLHIHLVLLFERGIQVVSHSLPITLSPLSCCSVPDRWCWGWKESGGESGISSIGSRGAEWVVEWRSRGEGGGGQEDGGFREVDMRLDLGRPELMGSDEEEKGISVPVNV